MSSLHEDMVPVDISEVFVKQKKTSQSWILIDATGNSMELDVDKYAVMQRVQIHARDLRIVDPDIFSPSQILCRERAIVLNLEHIKVIITAQEVLLRRSGNCLVISLIKEFQRIFDVVDDETPFEFRVLEVALEDICKLFSEMTTNIQWETFSAMDELTSKVSSINLDRIRKSKISLTKLTGQVQKVRDELKKIIDDEDDMAELYLTRKHSGINSSVSDSNKSPTITATVSRAKSNLVNPFTQLVHNVREIEMLLEAYFMQIDETFNTLIALREYIDDTEDYINIQLDTSRNQLMKFELILSVGSICVSVSSLVCGILGMNIPFSWNSKEYVFKWVVSATGTLCAVLFTIIMSYVRYKRLV